MEFDMFYEARVLRANVFKSLINDGVYVPVALLWDSYTGKVDSALIVFLNR